VIFLRENRFESEIDRDYRRYLIEEKKANRLSVNNNKILPERGAANTEDYIVDGALNTFNRFEDLHRAK